MKKSLVLGIIIAVVLVAALYFAVFQTPPEPTADPTADGSTLADAKIGVSPKLVLQLTVDQLRGDEPLRYQDRFVGGFRYLLDSGIWYSAAHHPHSHTETVVGHTTLVTCAYPAQHGMIGNNWYDTATGEAQNCVQDDETTIVGSEDVGSSPHRILTSTISDELTAANSQAKAFAVSMKDRSAVAMAGQSGKAFWFLTSGDQGGQFASSTFYYASYPQWVTDWNAQRRADDFAGQQWELLHDISTYEFKDQDNVYPPGSIPENAIAFQGEFGVGRNFPHPMGDLNGMYDNLTLSPFIDQLTAEFAMELIAQEGLGQDDVPDYLGISFSAPDIVAHWFSHASLESEDNLLQLDLTLQNLFDFIDQQIGLDNTLIVLSGDHGGPDFPEYLATQGVSTGRLTQTVIKAQVEQALANEYGSNSFLLEYQHPYFYLDQQAIEGAGQTLADVEASIVATLTTIAGVDRAVSASELPPGTDPTGDEVLDQIRRNQHSTRSGHVYMVQETHWQVDKAIQCPPEAFEELRKRAAPPRWSYHNDFRLEPLDADECAQPYELLLQHGSPWTYDTHVPVVFAGAGVAAGEMVPRLIPTVDVSAALAARLGINPPSGCEGTPLPEVIGSP